MSLQTARLVWLAFLISIGLIIAIAYGVIRLPALVPPAPAFSWAIAAVAIVQFIFISNLRNRLLERFRALSERGEAPAAQASWTLAQLLGFTTAESVVLFGFVLYTMEAQPPWISTTLFVAGLVALVAFFPRPTTD